jgi:murein DD-endopeptidase MepM/ murein hydrolase activator NlpD
VNTNRRKKILIAAAAVVLARESAEAQYNPNPAPGPYYFVSDTFQTSNQYYWGGAANGTSQGTGRDTFANVGVIENLNLLALVAGDDATLLKKPGQTLVAKETFNFGGGSILLQPFAFTFKGKAKKFNLPIGSQLRNFLNDPLQGAKFDLTLPFRDLNVALSDRSALIRNLDSARAYHTAVDFDYNGTNQRFDVLAPADGVVEGNSAGDTLAIRHTAVNNKQFLTIYSHIIPETKQNLNVGAAVVRGQVLGQVDSVPSDEHLHFGVAVEVAGRTIETVTIPPKWYLIDPFGVYDYRRNFTSSTGYNYVRDNTLESPIRGRLHSHVWRTDPPIGSLLLPEDCVSFNPNNLTIQASGGQHLLVDGGRFLFSFPNLQEATTARNILRQYGVNQSCFVGRPDASFEYLLVNSRSPVGPASGEDCVSFTPALLTLNTLSDGRVQMVSGNNALYVFPNMLEAGNALSVIKKYGFNSSCFVGRPDASLQYLRVATGMTGTFNLFPTETEVAVHDRLNYAFTWTVPETRNWHHLKFLQLRIRDGSKTIMSVLFDEGRNTLSLLDGTAGQYPAGSDHKLRTSYAALHLAETSVVAAGPTDPSVTVNLSVSFRHKAAGRTYEVEVAAADDLGNHDDFSLAAVVTVTPKD